jgi:hypothetical protein
MPGVRHPSPEWAMTWGKECALIRGDCEEELSSLFVRGSMPYSSLYVCVITPRNEV